MAGAESASLTRYAWAKVNLYLHVTGRHVTGGHVTGGHVTGGRPDGYHEIDSLIVFAGLGDRLSLAPAAEVALRVEGPFAEAVPAGEENLVLRAARGLADAAGVSAGASIALRKTLPAAAGLGGGSADAAAALDGLAALWGLAPGRFGNRVADRVGDLAGDLAGGRAGDLAGDLAGGRAGDWDAVLAEVARGLGADVPVCRFGRPAFVGGIGQNIERAPPLPPVWLVLVNCGVPLSTAEVYGARDGAFSLPGRWSWALPDAVALAEVLADLGNDLEGPALRLAPAVGEALARLASAPGVLLARLSGSGATCFGLFRTAAEADAEADAIAAERPDWWVAAAPLLHGPVARPWEV